MATLLSVLILVGILACWCGMRSKSVIDALFIAIVIIVVWTGTALLFSQPCNPACPEPKTQTTLMYDEENRVCRQAL